MGAGAWGLISVTWKGKREKKKKGDRGGLFSRRLVFSEAVWHNELMYVHLPFVVRCLCACLGTFS